MARGRKSENSTPVREIERPVPTSDIMAGLIDRAYFLRDRKKELYKEISSNRLMVRGLRDNGVISEDEARWADEFYKPREEQSEVEEVAA